MPITLPTFAMIQSGTIQLDLPSGPGLAIKISKGEWRKTMRKFNVTGSGDGVNTKNVASKRPVYWMSGVGWLVDGSLNNIDLGCGAGLANSKLSRNSKVTMVRNMNVKDVSGSGDCGTIDGVTNRLYSVWAPGTSEYEGDVTGYLATADDPFGSGTDDCSISALTIPIGPNNFVIDAKAYNIKGDGSFIEGGPWGVGFDFVGTGAPTAVSPFDIGQTCPGTKIYLNNGKDLIGIWLPKMIRVELDYASSGPIPVAFAGPFNGPVTDGAHS